MKELLDGLTAAVADRVIEDMRRRTEWVHQCDSPLGRNTHIRVARERAKRGGAGVVVNESRRAYLLTREALEEESRALMLARAERRDVQRESGVFGGDEVEQFRAQMLAKLGVR